MTCVEVYHLLTDYMLGELPPEQAKIVNRHLKKCAKCRAEYMHLQQIVGSLKEWADNIEIPSDLERNIEKSLSVNLKKPRRLQAAVSILLVVTCLGAWGYWFETKSKDTIPKSEQILMTAEQQEQMPREMSEKEDVAEQERVGVTSTTVTDSAQNADAMVESPPVEDIALDQRSLKEIQPLSHPSSVPDTVYTVPLMAAAIPPGEVVQAEIIIKEDGSSYVIDSEESKTLMQLAAAINEAQIKEQDAVREIINVTHVVRLRLENDKEYTFYYNLDDNIGYGEQLFAGQLIEPDRELAKIILRIVDK